MSMEDSGMAIPMPATSPIQLLDTVALLEEVPAERLQRGQVGTVVEILASGLFEVEFVDNEGYTYAVTGLRAEQLMVLHHQPVSAPRGED
jgi:hypothetical protein